MSYILCPPSCNASKGADAKAFLIPVNLSPKKPNLFVTPINIAFNNIVFSAERADSSLDFQS